MRLIDFGWILLSLEKRISDSVILTKWVYIPSLSIYIYIMCIYCIYTHHIVLLNKNPKTWKLARKEESHPHNSSCPGSIKSHKISLRRSFWLTYFIFCGHMEHFVLLRVGITHFGHKVVVRNRWKLGWMGSPWLQTGPYSARTEPRPPGSFLNTSRPNFRLPGPKK